MLLNLTDLSEESLQSQIARQIRAKILAGELRADTSLPSIRALAREQHVSVITVQRAYEHLMREELIHSRRGKGFFVSQLPKRKKKDMSKQRLVLKLEPLFVEAIAEGMAKDEIMSVIGNVLKKIQLDL